jgi:hypothetical protein
MEIPTQEDLENFRLSSSPALTPTIVAQPRSPTKSVEVTKMTTNPNGSTPNFFDDVSSEDDAYGQGAILTGHDEILDTTDMEVQADLNNYRKDRTARSRGEKNLPPPRPSRPSQKSILPDAFLTTASHAESGDFEEALPAADNILFFTGNRLSSSNSSAKFDPFLNAHIMTREAILRAGPDNSSPRATQFDPMSRSLDTEHRKRAVTLPAIDVNGSNKGHHEFVKTPYPVGVRKILGSAANPDIPTAPHDTILTLSLRRRCSQGPLRMTGLKIPAGLETSAGTGNPDKQFEALDFDDSRFVHELREKYQELRGRFCHVGARSLRAIRISHLKRCTVCDNRRSSNSASSTKHQTISSLTSLVPEDLPASFAEYNLFQLYKKPAAGKGKYHWVHWAHRLSSSSLDLLPIPLALHDSAWPCDTGQRMKRESGDVEKLDCQKSCVAGLEYIEGWNPRRIFAFAVLVKLLAVATTLLWILWGKSQVHPQKGAGFRDAGDRVASGCLLGILTLFIGWTTMAVWAFMSWLVV